MCESESACLCLQEGPSDVSGQRWLYSTRNVQYWPVLSPSADKDGNMEINYQSIATHKLTFSVPHKALEFGHHWCLKACVLNPFAAFR